MYILHRDDQADSRRILVRPSLPDFLRKFSVYGRMHRLAIDRDRKSVRLPPAWNKYQHNNLVSFFACPRHIGNFAG